MLRIDAADHSGTTRPFGSFCSSQSLQQSQILVASIDADLTSDSDPMYLGVVPESAGSLERRVIMARTTSTARTVNAPAETAQPADDPLALLANLPADVIAALVAAAGGSGVQTVAESKPATKKPARDTSYRDGAPSLKQMRFYADLRVKATPKPNAAQAKAIAAYKSALYSFAVAFGMPADATFGDMTATIADMRSE